MHIGLFSNGERRNQVHGSLVSLKSHLLGRSRPNVYSFAVSPLDLLTENKMFVSLAHIVSDLNCRCAGRLWRAAVAWLCRVDGLSVVLRSLPDHFADDQRQLGGRMKLL